MIGKGSSMWTLDEISNLVKWQRYLIWMITLYILVPLSVLFLITFMSAIGGKDSDVLQTVGGGLLLFVVISNIATGIMSMFSAYKVAKALRKGTAIIYALAMLLSVIGLIVLLVLNQDATCTLRANNIRVGLMGANAEDVERVKSQINTLPQSDI